jgi:hypothetical protein
LWLRFDLDPVGEGGTEIRQTTVFDPGRYVGLAYWYLLCPVHQLVFGRTLRGIRRAIRTRTDLGRDGRGNHSMHRSSRCSRRSAMSPRPA